MSNQHSVIKHNRRFAAFNRAHYTALTMATATCIWIAGVIVAGVMASFAGAQDSTTRQQSLEDYARAMRNERHRYRSSSLIMTTRQSKVSSA
jgi:hypothetical protein